MTRTEKKSTARIIGIVCWIVGLVLLLDEIFFNFISDGGMVPIAMFFLIISVLAFGSARKDKADTSEK